MFHEAIAMKLKYVVNQSFTDFSKILEQENRNENGRIRPTKKHIFLTNYQFAHP